MPRYIVINESQSAHCCFEATVVDSHTPRAGYASDDKYSQICECFSVEEAQKIADALNAAEPKPAIPPSYTHHSDFPAVQAALIRVKDKKGRIAALNIIEAFGVDRAGAIDPKHYPDVLKKCEEAL